mmetsp:Transcript_1394/g.3412  ORF Transcript_1394/g.3412 Transcript_1394/m.3412 type:complete len:236 (-) Transcript_1394:203-910(-)
MHAMISLQLLSYRPRSLDMSVQPPWPWLLTRSHASSPMLLVRCCTTPRTVRRPSLGEASNPRSLRKTRTRSTVATGTMSGRLSITPSEKRLEMGSASIRVPILPNMMGRMKKRSLPTDSRTSSARIHSSSTLSMPLSSVMPLIRSSASNDTIGATPHDLHMASIKDSSNIFPVSSRIRSQNTSTRRCLAPTLCQVRLSQSISTIFESTLPCLYEKKTSYPSSLSPILGSHMSKRF